MDGVGYVSAITSLIEKLNDSLFTGGDDRRILLWDVQKAISGLIILICYFDIETQIMH